MSSFDFNNSDEDWDSCEVPEWGEKEWQDYLRKQDAEVERFLNFYQKLPPSPNRVEETAALMGWEEDTEEEHLTEPLIELPSFLDDDLEDSSDREEDDFPILYTIHQHPVYTITQAILRVLIQKWEHYHGEHPPAINGHGMWLYSQKLNQLDRNVLMALQSLEMGDFALSICHLKWALSAVNHILSAIPEMAKDQTHSFETFLSDTKSCLFDLRQVWLKVIKECREEIKQQFDSGD